jgi:3-oxoacyl-[acyl-carrier-protein] synthase II
VTLFDASRFEKAIAGEVKEFRPEDWLPAKESRRMDRYSQLGCVAALEALADAGLAGKGPLGAEAGVVFGSGNGGMTLAAEQQHVYDTGSPRRVSPFYVTNILPDAVSGHIAVLTGALGPNIAVVAACATGAAAIGEAAEIIKRGDAEIVIAGGSEAPLTGVMYAGFAALRAVASADDPREACRPFDRRRNGFVVSEGAGAMVLESAEHAKRRGVPSYAEVAGYGSSNDAFDMVASEESGRGPVLAIEMALRKSGLLPTAIQYVNAHGTGTQMNDRVETLALKKVFRDHAFRLAVSSTKSMTGHMMGAAGAVEAVVTVLALRDGIAPPTINYGEPDPDCDLDYVPNVAHKIPGLTAALSTSVGLGGHNAALIFAKV